MATDGNDGWSGLLPEANGTGTDGPFATFDGARKAVQLFDKTDGGPISVQFRQGTYYLLDDPSLMGGPEILTTADSGTAATPITYQAYPGETVTISGGKRLRGWQAAGGGIGRPRPPV